MSASTVSISAKPSARRRPVEKKSPTAILPPDSLPFPTTTTTPSAADNHSHSLSRDGIVERSSHDAIQQLLKTNLPSPANTASGPTTRPRSSRKTNPKPEKPLWQTALSVFTKNFLLLLALAGIIQMVRKLALSPSSGDSSGGDNAVSFSSEEFEGRIAEVERFLKTSVKMMQVQMDVVDRKIENEVLDLKTELKGIEDRREAFERELGKLGGRTEGLEQALGELRSTEWLSKQDLSLFFDELRKKNKGSLGYGDLSLDEIRAVARGIVEKEIEKHAADGLGRVDYALASAGASVVKFSEPYGIGKGSAWLNTGNKVIQKANVMLKPSFGEPGQCFSLKGSNGFVEIRLRTAVIPEAITLEHVAKSVAYDRSSAPKDCRVSGWLQEPGTPEQMFLLAEFTYDLEKSNAQTFDVTDSVGSGLVDTVRLDIASNHGSAIHTCIYRLRVHGHEPDSVSLSASQS